MYDPRTDAPRRPASPPISWRSIAAMGVGTALLPVLLWTASEPLAGAGLVVAAAAMGLLVAG